jgi:hypothetical protein
MSSNMESTFQGIEGAEYFDFDTASGGFAEAVASSYTTQDFEMDDSPWNETLHNCATVNNDYPQYGTLANDLLYPDNFAMDNSVWAEMKPTLQPTGNTTVTYNLLDHPWDYDSSPLQNSFEFDGMELSAPTGTQNHLDFPFTQTIPGIEANSAVNSYDHARSQSKLGNSMDWVSPPEGRQSG